MIEIKAGNFNVEQICQSGQCFRMKRLERDPADYRYCLIAGNRYLELFQQGETVFFDCSQQEFEHVWRDYFDLGTDYGTYIGRIDPKDSYLMKAAYLGGGIRILRQDLWEMIVSFLISQQNNIPRIRRCIENICREYGRQEMTDGGTVYYSFPAPDALAALEDHALMACNLGYRSKYVVRAARSVVSGALNLEKVKEMSYPQAREELMKLFGVGEKVADCICLFALHQLDAFPVDTHINQAMGAHYKRGFPKRRYKGCRGVLQQYIFYYETVAQSDGLS